MGRCEHLGPEEREDVMVIRPHGRSIGEIARRIGRDKPTVSRETCRIVPRRVRPHGLLPGVDRPEEVRGGSPASGRERWTTRSSPPPSRG